MRKSKTTEKLIAGNADKYYAYREAWTRIKLAQENGFYLEAIAIQESIISDRLVSHLHCKQNVEFSTNQNRFSSFYKLIERWRLEFPGGISSGDYSDLIGAVDRWRTSRNQTIHAIVKSKPNQKTHSIDLFLQQAKEAAKTGEAIAKEVCKWSKKNRKLK